MRLVIHDPNGTRASIDFRGDSLTIGRHEGNDIRLPGRNVSRRHCRFDRSGAGITIEDLASTTGVRVDGVALQGRMHLAPGQQVLVGDYVMQLELPGAAAQAPVAPAPGREAGGGANAGSPLFGSAPDAAKHDDVTPGPPPLPPRHNPPGRPARSRRLFVGLGLLVASVAGGLLWIVVIGP